MDGWMICALKPYVDDLVILISKSLTVGLISKLEMASQRMHGTIKKLASRQSEVMKALGLFNVATKRWIDLPLKGVCFFNLI
jgi:hypothetical protein